MAAAVCLIRRLWAFRFARSRVDDRRFSRSAETAKSAGNEAFQSWGKAAPGSIDYAYWKDRGWLDTRRCAWFSRHRANPLKVAVARLVGSVVAVVAT